MVGPEGLANEAGLKEYSRWVLKGAITPPSSWVLLTSHGPTTELHMWLCFSDAKVEY